MSSSFNKNFLTSNKIKNNNSNSIIAIKYCMEHNNGMFNVRRLENETPHTIPVK